MKKEKKKRWYNGIFSMLVATIIAAGIIALLPIPFPYNQIKTAGYLMCGLFAVKGYLIIQNGNTRRSNR